MEIKNTIKLISKALGVKENKLNNKSHIGGIPEWDSLGHLNIFFAIGSRALQLAQSLDHGQDINGLIFF